MHKNILIVVGITLLFLGTCINPIVAIDTGKEFIDFHLKDGLLAYWKSDECDGITLWDCSGHNYDGTIYANWTAGGCLVFDGLDDYVDFDNHSENLGYNKTDDYIITFNFKSTSSITGSIYSMSHTDVARAFAYLDLNADGTISYKTGDETCLFEVATSGAYNDGDWHNVEVKFYGDAIAPTCELYVDGDLKDTITDWLCPYLAEDFKTAKMGRRSASSTNYFDGIIDEVRIYKCSSCPPPSKPIIDGPTKGKPNIVYNFTITSTDPQGLDISYFIEWSDGSTDGWTAPLPSGTPYNFSIVFSEMGTYIFCAIAKNSCGAVSELSCFKIDISRTRTSYLWYEWLLERFPLLERLLSFLLL